MATTSLISTDDNSFQLSYINYDCAMYDDLFSKKCNETMQYLQNHGVSLEDVSISLFSSPAKHYRQRCRFAVEKYASTSGVEALRYMVWDHGSASVQVEHYPLASELICRCMPLLLCQLQQRLCLAQHLKAINFLSTTTAELLITLIYDYPLDETAWMESANALGNDLSSLLGITSLSIIGRSKKLKLVIGNEFVVETLRLDDGRALKYKQMHDGFSNPNAVVNAKSLNWICCIVRSIVASGPYLHSSGEERDVLELYCGNGNHTVAIAEYAYRVVAVEINKSLCSAATENFANNDIHNARIIACDSEKFTKKILREKKYIDEETSTEYYFHTVLVDPPRAGLDKNTLALVGRYRNIIYISCNPVALQRDLAQLLQSHSLVSFAIFDQFAYTLHVECGVHLRLKS